jgi:eukaryotic-like serine/threonine-protein kinase
LALTPGTRLGVYDITAQIGEGGMGQVYRATDTKLKRHVAIKILPLALAADSDRLARFQREAEVLASLNHPNIAAIYGLEESGGVFALVMELVEGLTLADRIAKGALPVEEALPIAKQIADAVEAAHEQGIIHRDLKPANIKVRSDGTVKVLDFGLAKAMEPAAGSSPNASMSPTEPPLAVTQAGTILGTTAYMSPEQARGLAVDKRTDLWAFGCVLYELLTGQRAFPGETVSDTIAAVLGREPNWAALPSATAQDIRRLLRRCLEKDLKRRLRDFGDARIDLDDAARGTSEENLGRTLKTDRRWRIMALAASATVAVLAAFPLLGGSELRQPSALDRSAYRFIPLAAEPADETSPSWSPDGKTVVYAAEINGLKQLFTRTLDSALSSQITKSATDCLTPFWSPDGTRIYFISQDTFGGGSLWSVGATGGEPQLVMKGVGAATAAPDGKALAFLRGAGGSRSLWITNTATMESQKYRTPPFPETFTRSGSVEFSRDGSKIAVLVERQDGTDFKSDIWIVPYPAGTPRRILEHARDVTGGRVSWALDNRHLVLDSVFFDRPGTHLYLADAEDGTLRPITTGTVDEQSPSVSPNGDRIAFAAGSDDFDLIQVALDGADVHTLLATSRSETRPAWSPTGTQIAYVTNARGTPEIWIRSVEEGWARPVVKRDSEGSVSWQSLGRPSFSPDGQRIVYELIGTKHAVWVASVADGRGVPLDQESPDQHSPAWSPDGNWVAYQRLLGGKWELAKVALGGGKPVRIAEATPGGGDHTAWSPSGEWIAHVVAGTLRLTSADGQTQKTLSGSPPAAFGFSLDAASLYAVRHATNGTWVLVAFDVRSGQERDVADLHLPPRATLSGFSLHPNGKSFATGVGIARHDIWLLEGFKLPAGWLSRLIGAG